MINKAPFDKKIEAKTHPPIYTIHRYFARRPHNVFSELIRHYTQAGDVVLDPFCGGGVTVVESLALQRKSIGVDVNPLAAYVTRMQVLPINIDLLLGEYERLKTVLKPKMNELYSTTCATCKYEAQVDWTEWKDEGPVRIQYLCSHCGRRVKAALETDLSHATEIADSFQEEIRARKLWYPENPIPSGDKTNSIIQKGYRYFWELFTKRNLLALALLHKEIANVTDCQAREFLYFAFSASLKWASKQCHLRGEIVEGWAMHAYWIYPKQLEINIWSTFEKRVRALVRGKKYMRRLDVRAREAKDFSELLDGANCLVLSHSADSLPLPERSVDCVITDPPYGGNVNYGELSDFWTVWNPEIRSVVDKSNEAVVNRTQGKDLNRYEEILAGVFRECDRVLKPEGRLVATFNSKDLSVVCSFLRAIGEAGFELVENGLHYQAPIKAYTTTVHAKEVGAFTGDFIFTFRKMRRVIPPKQIGGRTLQQTVDEAIAAEAKRSRTEIEFRRSIYQRLIPLLAEWVHNQNGSIRAIADYAEQQIRKQKFEQLPFTEARLIAR